MQVQVSPALIDVLFLFLYHNLHIQTRSARSSGPELPTGAELLKISRY
jgi:hypothetical protein